MAVLLVVVMGEKEEVGLLWAGFGWNLPKDDVRGLGCNVGEVVDLVGMENPFEMWRYVAPNVRSMYIVLHMDKECLAILSNQYEK